MIISWPKGLGHENEISTFPAHLIDILPTLAELAGASYPNEFEGKPVLPAEGQSLLPAVRGEKFQREEPIFWEWSVGKAVRKGDWKLVSHGKNAAWELYNLKLDPTETKNLITQQPEIASELEDEFQNWKTRVSR